MSHVILKRLSILASILLITLTLCQVKILHAETTVTVGVYNNAPTIFVDTDGTVKGLFIDILEYIAQQEDWKITYQPGHFSELLIGLQNNEIDLLPAVAYSKEREKYIDYTFETVMSNWAELYSKNSKNINSLLDIEGKVVAVKEGDIHFLAVKKMAENFNINVRFFETDEYTTVFEMLQADYVDIAVVNRLFGNRNMKKYGVKATQVIFNPIEMKYAVPKGKNIEILGALDAHLTRLKTDTQSVYYGAINRWFVLGSRQPIPKWLLHALYTVLALAVLLTITATLFRQQVRKRTTQLESSNQNLTAQIKERRKAEEQLQKFERIVEASSDAMALIDRNNNHVLANRTYRKIIGFTSESVEGIPLKQLLGDNFFNIELKNAVNECLRGEVTQVQTRPRKAHANTSYWNVTLSPYFLQSDKPDGYVIDIRDVTDQVELQNRLKNSQKMEAIGMLAGGVAHDLNNILSGLVSYPDMLLVNRAENDPMTKPLKTIKKSGERAAAIVQDMLTLARRGIGHAEPQNLNTIIQEFLISPEHDDILRTFDGIEVTVDLEKDLSNLQGSAPHLSKLLMNLFTNSLEAMTAGGKLLFTTRNISFLQEHAGYEVIPPGEYISLSVVDTGIGMTKAELNRVFEPFYTKKVMGRSGTGLGMAVVWGSVKDHHGYVDIESTVGNGTIFSVYFPTTSEEVIETEETLHQFTGKGETILIVDDLEEQRSLAQTIITKLGYIGETAASGEAAIKKCMDNDYDLLILDMIMPEGIDGLTTYERIKRVKPEQKAIIASGFSESSRVKKAQEIGAGVYIKKPYTVESLAKGIHQELDS